MRLLLALSVLAASMQPALGLHSLRALVTSYPACTAAQSKTFTENLDAVSSGCAKATSYDWDGDADPTDSQRKELCKCTVSALTVPKCHWTKLGQYDVTVSEHFIFAYNCSSISGKATPKLTEVDAASYTPTPVTEAPNATTEAPTDASPASTTAASTSTTTAPAAETTSSETSSDCTVSQLNAFTGALNTASSGCMGASSYNWGGSMDPTETQYKEICKCAAVSAFTIPTCYIQKAQSRITLSQHYNWVTGVQCPTFTPSTTATTERKSSSKVGLIAGVLGGIVAVIVIVAIAFFLYKRSRHEKEEEEHQYQPHGNVNAMCPPMSHQQNYQQNHQQSYQQKRERPPLDNINTI